MKAFAELDSITFKIKTMVSNNKLSRLMKLSWDIQRSRNSTRSKSLSAAWAIISNEHLTVYYLTRRLNRDKPLKNMGTGQFALFG